MSSVLGMLPRFRAAKNELESLAQRETWTRDRIEQFQLERINEVWQHARSHVPHYRDLSIANGLPSRFNSLQDYVRQMPITEKSIIRKTPKVLLSEKAEPGTWHRTGGSTGDPLKVYWSRQAHRRSLWAKYRMEDSFGLDFLDRKAMLWGHDGSFATGWQGQRQRFAQSLGDILRRRQRLSAYRLGERELMEHLRHIARFRPASLYGYSSAVYVLAQHAARHGIAVGSLRLCILTAEPAHSFMLDTVSKALGCPATIEYGSVECGTIATGTSEGVLRVREDCVFAETLPEPSGQWQIIVTVLNNPSFPLLRYRIGDMTCAPLDFPSQGFAALSCVLGRNNDILVSRNGNLIHSMAIKHVLEADPLIRRFQVVQAETGDLSVLIEPVCTEKSINLDRIRHHLSSLVDGYAVSIKVTDTIKGNLAGKHRWILSEAIRSSRPNAEGFGRERNSVVTD